MCIDGNFIGSINIYIRSEKLFSLSLAHATSYESPMAPLANPNSYGESHRRTDGRADGRTGRADVRTNVLQTDGRTDGQTDSVRLSVPYSAVPFCILTACMCMSTSDVRPSISSEIHEEGSR